MFSYFFKKQFCVLKSRERKTGGYPSARLATTQAKSCPSERKISHYQFWQNHTRFGGRKRAILCFFLNNIIITQKMFKVNKRYSKASFLSTRAKIQQPIFNF